MIDVTAKTADLLVKARRLVECQALIDWAINEDADENEGSGTVWPLIKDLHDALDGATGTQATLPQQAPGSGETGPGGHSP